MVNKMIENFKHVFKFGHQPIYYSVFFFNFLILCHWLASQEGFKTVKKTSLKNATKLNSESKCGQKLSKFVFQTLANFYRIL